MSTVTFHFEGRVALVTGAGSGIGFEMTQQFLRSGAFVVAWDYSPQSLENLKKLGSGDRLWIERVDVGSTSDLNMAASNLPKPLNFLVNNAGITRDKTLAKMSVEDWEAVIRTNLSGVFLVTKTLLDKFDQGGPKRIVNISSIVGIHGNFGQSNYAAAKAGVIGLTKTWAKELGRKGFQVNAIAPGFIETPMTAAMPQEVLQQIASRLPLQRLGKPEDIAKVALFLCSDEASYIHGTVLNVDGGLVL